MCTVMRLVTAIHIFKHLEARGGSRIFWVGGSKKRRINTGKSRHTLGGGGGPKGGRSMWKKNENQIMLRCLLKHYKIRIFQVYFCTLDFELHPPP